MSVLLSGLAGFLVAPLVIVLAGNLISRAIDRTGL